MDYSRHEALDEISQSNLSTEFKGWLYEKLNGFFLNGASEPLKPGEHADPPSVARHEVLDE